MARIRKFASKVQDPSQNKVKDRNQIRVQDQSRNKAREESRNKVREASRNRVRGAADPSIVETVCMTAPNNEETCPTKYARMGNPGRVTKAT